VKVNVINVDGVWHARSCLEPTWDADGWHVHAQCGAVLHVKHDFPWNNRNKGMLWDELTPACMTCAMAARSEQVGLVIAQLMGKEWNLGDVTALVDAIHDGLWLR